MSQFRLDSDIELPEDAEAALDRLSKQKGVAAVVVTDASGTLQRSTGDPDACKLIPAAVGPLITLTQAMLRELEEQDVDLLRVRGAGLELAVVPGADFVVASVQAAEG